MRPDLRPVRELRDLPVVDAEGRLCGVVDEVLFEGEPGKPLRLAAIQIGPGAWARRLPPWAMAVVRRLGSGEAVTIPWREVEYVTGRVTLKRRAEDLGLGAADRRLAPPLARVPFG